MRLIDADALKKAVENLCVGGEEQIKHNRSDGIYWLDGICDAYREINNAPTVKRKSFATVTFDKDELNRIVDERVIEPIKNGELVIKEKRPTGHWIKETTDDLPVPFELLVCSNCKKEAIIDDWNCYVKSDFCPNCGAEMGKEAENDAS